LKIKKITGTKSLNFWKAKSTHNRPSVLSTLPTTGIYGYDLIVRISANPQFRSLICLNKVKSFLSIFNSQTR
jgi:hypothetical protein